MSEAQNGVRRWTPERKRAYQREWIARRRAEFFAGKSCALCASIDRLELDHLDPAEKVDHKIWSWSAARREAEASKCRVLCRACHVEHSKAQMREARAAGPAACSKLRPDDVREIRRLLALGETLTAIAARFNVSRTTARRAANGTNWSHVA